MCGAGIAVFAVALWAARTDIARAPGLDKVVAIGNLCFAVPIAVFGALHLASAKFLVSMVPPYMPGRLFWAYFVGFALLAAALSIATKFQVKWSGLLFGIMMFLFVAMLYIPRALSAPGDRFGWTLVLRESAFAGGGWALASSAWSGRGKGILITVSRVVIAMAAIFYGVEHFLHPLSRPGVPLEGLMPPWIPARILIGYLTGALLLVAGIYILLARKTRMAATVLGAWIVLLVVVVYGPILYVSLMDPNTGTKIEGIDYFADTLLFAGAILALARATPCSSAK